MYGVVVLVPVPSVLVTPVGNSQSYEVAVAAGTAFNFNTVEVPIYLAKLVIGVVVTPLVIVSPVGAVGKTLVNVIDFAAVLQPLAF